MSREPSLRAESQKMMLGTARKDRHAKMHTAIVASHAVASPVMKKYAGETRERSSMIQPRVRCIGGNVQQCSNDSQLRVRKALIRDKDAICRRRLVAESSLVQRKFQST
jgi:hypothetical protein